MHAIRTGLMLALSVVLLGGAAAAQSDAAADLDRAAALRGAPGISKVSGQVLDRMVDAARTEPTRLHRVVVQLASGESPETLKSLYADPDRLAQIRSRVSDVQELVLGNRTAGTMVVRYRCQSLFGIEVDADNDAILELAAMPQVELVFDQPELTVHSFESHPLTGVDLVHGAGFTGAGVTIAIVDDGVDTDHPAFGGFGAFPNSKIIGGFDAADGDGDPNPVCAGSSHGTSCAGVAAGNATVDFTGVARDARIVAVKIQTDSTCGSPSLDGSVVTALDWILTNANTFSPPIKIVSMSFGSSEYSSVAACEADRPGWAAFLQNLEDAGLILLSSSGNDGLCDSIGWPSCHAQVISVGATYDADVAPGGGFCFGGMSTNTCQNVNTGFCPNEPQCLDAPIAADQVTCYSNSSATMLDILAPSHCATTAAWGGGINTCFGGTSSACPFAAGVAALVLDKSTGTLNTSQMRAQLVNTGVPIFDPKNAVVKPRVDALNAIGGCVPSAPDDVTCDGVDDDCNGAIDDGDGDGDGSTVCNDCDDTNGAVKPGATEICDGVDNDCDGGIDEGLSTDNDNDNHYTPGSCAQPDDDCDDGNAARYPGNPELCDGVDNDCDSVVPATEIDNDFDGQTECDGDCDDTNVARFTGNPEVCDGVDNDCDSVVPATEIDNDFDGQTECDGDCDDTNAARFTGNPEVCDGVDNDCDSVVPATEIDNDFDGQTECDGDCDDTNAARFTGNPEVCDGVDNDCDSVVPATEIDNDGDGQSECNGDCDDTDDGRFTGNPEICDGLDNDCDTVIPGTEVDNDGDGFAECEGDCNDSDGTISPSAAEACDGIDNDCDGGVDEGLTFDADGDGATTPGSCSGSQDDCDDNDVNNFPGNAESCDQADNDCDGTADEGLSTDLDGDGHYVPGSCLLPADDCDDNDGNNFPTNPEACDGADNDCDGAVDNGLSTDGDGDGVYAPGSCFTPNNDCDDNDVNNFPGNVESCDQADNDCDGTADEGLSTDLDGDGHYVPGSCLLPADDCDDNDGNNFPTNPEVCDGEDNDCDGAVDNGLSTDGDGDGVYAPGSCFTPNNDCDDSDGDIFPGNPEICDGKDNDCNAGADDGLTSDGDADGFTAIGSCEGSADDCDDDNGSAFPGAPELCDGVDNDCDGSVPSDEIDDDGDTLAECEGDCDDTSAARFPGNPEICDRIDNDCDGVVPAGEIDDDGDGFTECEGDCDDANAATFPGAPESCDRLDNNCDGVLPALEIDGDGDGLTTCEGDCVDTNSTIRPGLAEQCDGLDNDCNGVADFDGLGETDDDGDGVRTCEDDCDDDDANNFPGNEEQCDDLDNNCDGEVDEDACDVIFLSTATTHYVPGTGTMHHEKGFRQPAGTTSFVSFFPQIAAGIGVDALDRDGDDVLFSVTPGGGTAFINGSLQQLYDGIVYRRSSSGSIQVDPAWDALDFDPGSINALDRQADGSFVVSVETGTTLVYGGRFRYLRPWRLYRVGPSPGDFQFIFDGWRLGFRNIDCVDVDGETITVSPSRNGVPLIPGGVSQVFSQNTYDSRPSQRAPVLRYDGAAIGLQNLDACIMRVFEPPL